MNVFITGITGMVGSVFAEKYREKGHQVYGIARNSSASRQAGVQDPFVIRCDVTDRDMLEAALEQVKPDIIIHTAAQAFNNTSWKCEYLTHMTNYMGTLNVLKCAQKICPDSKVMLCCSSTEYGAFDPEDCPLKEEHTLRPTSPYGVSKTGVEQLGYQYFSNYGLKVFLPRMFIHVGVGHPPATAIQNFARQLALIAKGKEKPIMKVGRLDTVRDFIDARDGVEAMITLLEKGRPGVPVNICTGRGYSIQAVLDMLLEISGLDVDIQSDKALFRASDEPRLIGDNTRIKSLGFHQKYELRETLEEVYKNWLERV